MISIANIRVHDDELIDKALNRFKKLVEKEGIVREYKRREYFEKPSTINHRKRKALVRKQAKKLIKLQGIKNY